MPMAEGLLFEPSSGVAPGVEAQNIYMVGELEIALPYPTNLFGTKMLLPAGTDVQSA